MSTTVGAFISGGVAACGAVTVTHGFETVKIRLQLQGELQAKEDAPRIYRGVFHGMGVVVKNEGLKGLLKGMNCAYIYQVLMNGCRLGFYEPIRSSLSRTVYADPSAPQSFAVNTAAGASAGILGAIAGSPFFLVKTRQQSFSPLLPVGTQYEYRGAWDGLSSVYRSEGVKGLYRGLVPAIVRTGFGGSVQLPTYFLAKQQLQNRLRMENGPSLHLLSSTASGIMVCCVMHPPDTVMSRMYNQSGNLYHNAWDCLKSMVKIEGPLALYKGFFAHLARLLPHTVLTLTLAEQTTKIVSKIEARILREPFEEAIL